MLSYVFPKIKKNIIRNSLFVIELFSNPSITAPLKTFLKKAFILHVTLEISRLSNPKIDNHYTLQQRIGLFN